jgi:uncharacterized protein YbbC (DUF1343 family)
VTLPSSRTRLLSRAAALLGVLALAALAAGPSLGDPALDPDFFWHELLGERLLEDGRVVAPDDISYTSLRAPYRRHSWGFDAALGLAKRDLGGVSPEAYRWARAAIRALTVALVALACLRAARSRARGRRPLGLPLLPLALAALFLPFSWTFQELRPIAIVHALLAASVALHYAAQRTPGAATFAATVAIGLLLGPIHPATLVHVALAGALLAGALLERRAARASAASPGALAEAERRVAYTLTLTGALVLVLALDPEPFGAITSVIALRADPMARLRLIEELLPPQSVGAIGWLGIAIAFAAAVALARSPRTRPHEPLALAGLATLGLDLARGTILLAILALPLLARHVRLRPRLPRALRLARTPALGLALAALLALLATARSVAAARAVDLPREDWVAAARLAGYPADATTWAGEHLAPPAGRPGRIVTPFTWGGYIARRLAPRHRVSLYGQNVVFEGGIWVDFARHRAGSLGRRLLEGEPDAAILPDQDHIVRHLLEESGFTVAHRSGGAVVLRAPARAARAPAPLAASAPGEASEPDAARATGGASAAALAPAPAPAPVLSGLEALAADGFAPLLGKRVGLVANHTARDRAGRSAIDLLRAAPGVSLTALFAPEHGLRGAADAPVASGIDERTGLKVYSLYGATRRPTAEMLREVDVLAFDMQDVGARYYTYATTLAYCLEAASEHGKAVLVLDRPNPIGGVAVEGPVLEPALRGGFAAHHALPTRHGLTLGEIALWYRGTRGLSCALEVVPARGWRRALHLDEAGLPWVDPSPNLRSLDAALHYAGLGALEGTNLSVGRGTETPFEIYGAPWVDGEALARALEERRLPGVRFRATGFTPRPLEGRPRYPYTGEACRGVRVEVTDRAAYPPVTAALHVADALLRLHPDRFRPGAFAGMIGRRDVEARLRAGEPPDAVAASWEEEIAAFRRERAPFLLYPDE